VNRKRVQRLLLAGTEATVRAMMSSTGSGVSGLFRKSIAGLYVSVGPPNALRFTCAPA
jgi:hypothetical protein